MNPDTPINDIEKMVLGAALSDQGKVLSVIALAVDHFANPDHRIIHRSMERLADAEKLADELTIPFDLEQNDEKLLTANLEEMVVAGAGVTDETFQSYISTLGASRKKKLLAEVARTIALKSADPSRTADELIGEAFQALISISGEGVVGPRRISDLLALGDFDETIPTEKTSAGILPTGFYDLDKMTSGGMRPGELWVVAGRPGAGKSAFGGNVAQSVAKRGTPVVFFSLEMTALSLIQRMICAEGSVDYSNFRRAALNPEEARQAKKTLATIRELPIWIDDRASISVEEVFAQTKRLTIEHGIKLVVVDYLQLLTSNQSRENRQQEVANVSGGLSRISKECGVPVLALAQLRRMDSYSKKGPPSPPKLQDLRESGAIEQDASVVLFPFRPELYDKEDHSLYGLANIYIAKQRDGATGKVEMQFEGEYVRFVNS